MPAACIARRNASAASWPPLESAKTDSQQELSAQSGVGRRDLFGGESLKLYDICAGGDGSVHQLAGKLG